MVFVDLTKEEIDALLSAVEHPRDWERMTDDKKYSLSSAVTKLSQIV